MNDDKKENEFNFAFDLCIEFSLDYKRQRLDDEIRNIRLWSCSEWPSFKKGWLTWKPTLIGRIGQALVFPLAFLLVAVMALFNALLDFYEEWQRKRELQKKKKALAAVTPPYQLPDEKSFAALWRYYGLDRECDLDSHIEVMERWIEILYGREVLQRFDLKARADTILNRNVLANDPWHKGDENAAHFHFIPVADSLLRGLARDLPPYERAEL